MVAGVPWVETPSLSFTARHEASQADDALAVLEDLEQHRGTAGGAAAARAGERHGGPARLTAPAAVREPAAGGHAPTRLAGRAPVHGGLVPEPARCTPSRRRRCARSPRARTPSARCCSALAAPTRRWRSAPTTRCCRLPRAPARCCALLREAWLPEGAAQHFAGQVPFLRAAIATRLRAGRRQVPARPARRRPDRRNAVRPAAAGARRARLRAARHASRGRPARGARGGVRRLAGRDRRRLARAPRAARNSCAGRLARALIPQSARFRPRPATYEACERLTRRQLSCAAAPSPARPRSARWPSRGRPTGRAPVVPPAPAAPPGR